MIALQTDDISEKQLAQIALAIQNRWEVPAFVKMHEIVVMEEDGDLPKGRIPLEDFERGMHSIFENLEISSAFRFERSGKSKYRITRIEGSSLPQWMDDINTPASTPEGVYECPHCVPPETLILGDNKPIAEYERGNLTVGRSGLGEVIQTFVRPYEGEMVAIKPNGMLPILTTPEHPILVTTSHTTNRRQKGRLREIKFSKERWVAAKDVVAKTSYKDGDYVILPILNGNYESYTASLSPFIKKRMPNHAGYREHFPLNKDSAWLLGLYAAEGSSGKEVRFPLNKNEEEIRRKVSEVARGLGYSTYTQYSEKASSVLVTVTSRVLARAFDTWCGHGAPNKKIPDFILYHKDEKILEAFLRGYVAANQLRGNKKYRVSATTSKILAQQLQLAYARLRMWASILFESKITEELIMAGRCSPYPKYYVSYPLDENIKRQKVRLLEDRILCPIRSVRRESYAGRVYNMETADNTYLVSNAIVHNCGKWFSTDMELSLHTKLHYIV